MEKIDYWRLCDELSVVQATLLIVGVDPVEAQDYIDNWQPNSRPDGYDAVLSALQHTIKAGKLKAIIHYQPTDGSDIFLKDTEMDKWERTQTPNWHSTIIKVDDLKDWLSSRGFDSGFFFPDDVEKVKFLDPKNSCFAPKLAAAVYAWKAVSGNEKLLNGKTPKQAIEKWLREHASQYGLTKEDGSPNEQGIEEIAKVANWNPQGGAAKTPTAANLNPINSNPPTLKKTNKKAALEEKLEDDDISF